MKKYFLIVLLFTLMMSSCGILRNKMTNETYNPVLNSPKNLSFSPITWHNDSIGDELVGKTSFYVPVMIKGIDQQVFMQFDLGANISMLYENTLLAFIENNADLKIDTIDKKNHIGLKTAEIKISDSVTLTADKLYVKKNYGYSYIDSAFTIIGTLGYDIIGDNVLILDFKNNQYALSEAIPSNMEADIQYIEKADLDKFPIILPFKLGKKKIRLFYDTGTSKFPILTGTKRLKKIAINREIDTVGFGSSWGVVSPYYKAQELKINNHLFLGNISLGEVEIYGSDDLNFFSFLGHYLYGITGNILFDNTILIIDRKNNRFGIIK